MCNRHLENTKVFHEISILNFFRYYSLQGGIFMFDIKKSKNYLLVPEDKKAKSRKKSTKASEEIETSEEVIMETLVFDENIRPLRCYKCKSENVEPMVSKKISDDGKEKPRIETRKLIDVYENNVVKVALNKIRYKCNNCPATFTLDDLYPSDIMYSPEFENFIAQMIISGEETEATIVKKYGISAGKVSGGLKKYITKFHNSDFKVYPCPTMYFHKFAYGKKLVVLFAETQVPIRL